MFYKRDRKRYGFLSNFYTAPVELDGRTWPTSEHYYQAMKSNNPAYWERILKTNKQGKFYGPGYAKRTGNSLIGSEFMNRRSWFHKHPEDLREDWDTIKPEVMHKVVRAKFTQHEDLKAKLLKTGTAVLIEDSQTDDFWGMGPQGCGQNWLGRILMEIRDELVLSE